MAPHVYVGVDSIITDIRAQQALIGNTPSKKRARRAAGNKEISEMIAGFEDVHIPALIIVVAAYTMSRVKGPPSSGTQWEGHRNAAVQLLLKLVPGDERQEEEEMVRSVEEWLKEAQNEEAQTRWMEMEWFLNLPETAGEEEAPDSLEEVEVAKRGFGTMMTDATDWLSEGRRSEFKRWRADVMKRIAEVERDGKKAVK